MIFALVFALGVAVAGVSVWQHRGRTPRARSWAHGTTSLAERRVLVLWPMFAVIALCAGALGPVAGTAAAVPFVLGMLVGFLVFLAYGILPLPIPHFAIPRWYAAERAGRRSRRG